MLIYLIIRPIVDEFNLNAEFALNLAFLSAGVAIPIYILKKAKRQSGESVIGLALRSKWYEYIIYPLLAIALAVAIISLVPISNVLENQLEPLLPEWFLQPWRGGTSDPSIVLFLLIFALLVDGFIHPIVEEYYFRGFLLKKLSHYGWFAPVLSALFFSLFHLWQPQNIPIIFLSSLPWMFIVWWKKDLLMSIVIHCLANSIGAIVAIISHIN